MKAIPRLKPVAKLGTGIILCASLAFVPGNRGIWFTSGQMIKAQEQVKGADQVSRIIKQLSSTEKLTEGEQAELIIKLQNDELLEALNTRFLAALDQEKVDAWIADLSSEEYYKRDEAAMSLFKIRALIRSQLVKAMNDEITIEAKELIQAILDRDEDLSDLTQEDELVLNFLDLLSRSATERTALQLHIYADKHLHPVIRQRAALKLYKVSNAMVAQLLHDYLIAISENSSEKISQLDQDMDRIIKRQSRVQNFQWTMKINTFNYLKQMRQKQLKVVKEGSLDILGQDEAHAMLMFYAFLLEDLDVLKSFKTERKALAGKIASFKLTDQGLDAGELSQRIEYLQKFLHLHHSNETEPLSLPRERHLVLLKRLSGLYKLRQEMQGIKKETVKWELEKLKLSLRMESVDQQTIGYVDLLMELAKNKKEMPKGFEIKNGALMLARGSFRTLELSPRPQGAFELRLRVTRTEGRDALYIGFPVSDTGRHAGLNISGWGGEWSGVDMIRNMEASDNPSTAKASIKQNQTYDLQIVVTYPKPDQISIQVLKDGNEYITWTGQEADVRGNTIWPSDDRGRLLIGSHATVYRVDQLLYRALSEKEAKLKTD